MGHIHRSFLLCCALLLFLPAVVAQKKTPRQIKVYGISDPQANDRLMRQLQAAPDTTAMRQMLSDWMATRRRQGRAEATADAVFLSADSVFLRLHEGPRYLIDSLQIEGANPLYLERTGLDNFRQNTPLDWTSLQSRLNTCLDQYQNEGFPFAAFTLSTWRTRPEGDTIYNVLKYQLDPGPLVTVDSIRIEGKHREQDAFIYSLIRITPGQPYSQRLVTDIPRVLNNSIYYQKVMPPKVRFRPDGKATLTLQVEQKKAGKFDFLLGFLPAPANTQDQRLQVTGNADVLLVSPLRQGELIQFRYNKLTSSSRQTYIRVALPYLLRTPLRVEGDFDLLKQEEDFLNISYQGSGIYAFSPFLSARFYYRSRGTRLLGEGVSDSLLLRQLDGLRRTAGVGFEYENLDYRNNPSRGWTGKLDLGIGQRTIRRNVLLPDRVYEGLDLQQPVREILLEIKWYHQLFERQILHLANRSAWLGMEQYYRNDQWQLGGARSIRGFNENQLFADFYTFFTAEYRFQLERDSYLFAFFDYAWLDDRNLNQQQRPAGLGLGMNYGTKAGIISLVYAVGSNGSTPFQPSRGKIHIGIVNLF